MNNLRLPANDDDMDIIQNWWDGKVSLDYASCKTNIPEEKLLKSSLSCVKIFLHESETQFKALLDSGAGVSTINQTLVNQLGCTEEPFDGSIRLADGKVVNVQSKVRLRCSVGDQTGWITFVVMNGLSHDIILGNDFITLWKIITSAFDGTYRFHGSNQVFRFLYTGNSKECNNINMETSTKETKPADNPNHIEDRIEVLVDILNDIYNIFNDEIVALTGEDADEESLINHIIEIIAVAVPPPTNNEAGDSGVDEDTDTNSCESEQDNNALSASVSASCSVSNNSNSNGLGNSSEQYNDNPRLHNSIQ